MKSVANFLLYPLKVLRHTFDNYLKAHNPELLYCIYFKRETGIRLNVHNPKTLDEIVAYNAFHCDTTLWSILADKVRVREFIISKGVGHILPKSYGFWESSRLIDFNQLPNSFVIKTNNASATNIIVKDKSLADLEAIKIQLDKWLKNDYGYHTAQPHYSRMKPLILAEELLVDERSSIEGKPLKDFKFYCVNGRPLYVIIYTDRVPNSHDMKRTLYDMNWISHPELLGKSAIHGPEVEKPQCFEDMVSYAKLLSEDFQFVRVDFYDINNKPVFGELTFTPGVHETSYEFSELLGKIMKSNNEKS